MADEVWHAGDIGNLEVTDIIKKRKPLKAVYGNIDDAKARLEFPLHNRFMCENVDVWITHIGGYPDKYNPNIRTELQNNPPKLFICGHSHILKVQLIKLNLLHRIRSLLKKRIFIGANLRRFVIDDEKFRMEIIGLGSN